MRNNLVQNFQEIEELRRSWGWCLGLGVVLLLLGFLALFSVYHTTMLSVIFIGALLLVSGVLQIIYSVFSHRWTGFFLAFLAGLFYAVAGFLFIEHPHVAAIALTMVLALLFVVLGIFRIVDACYERYNHWGWVVFNGIVTLLLGILLWAEWPLSGLWFIGLLVGIELIIAGLGWIMIGWSAKESQPLV